MAERKERAPVLEHLERLPVVASELVQLDPGDLGLNRTEVRGRDSFIVRIRTGARSIWTSVPEVDWVGYSIPITWKGDYLLNGMSATQNTVFKLDGAHEFDVVADSRDFITVGLRRSVLSRMISGLIGRDFVISVNTYQQLQVPEALRDRLLRILWKPLEWAPSNGSAATLGRLPRSIEVAFMEAIADWIVETDHLNTSVPVSRQNELRIFRDSICKIREADHLLLTIADLCQLVGVGKSQLHQAFSETYGISPGAYLHRLRLTSIREELLSEETPPRSVKDVAIKYGFLSSGQFARTYREIFGELPGETLRKRMASSGSERLRTPRIRSRGHPGLAPNAKSEP